MQLFIKEVRVVNSLWARRKSHKCVLLQSLLGQESYFTTPGLDLMNIQHQNHSYYNLLHPKIFEWNDKRFCSQLLSCFGRSLVHPIDYGHGSCFMSLMWFVSFSFFPNHSGLLHRPWGNEVAPNYTANMMTSSNGNIFRVTGPLCGNSTVNGEFPAQRPVTRGALMFTLLLTWWRRQMEPFSALLALCVGNSTVNGEFLAQRPVTRSFEFSWICVWKKYLSNQSRGWWFETLPHPLWCHCNELNT